MKALILLSSLGVITLLAEIFSFKKVLYPVVLLGIASIFILNAIDWNTNVLYFNMMRFDNYAVAFTGVILLIAFLWFLMAQDFFKEETNKTDHYALVIFALAGAVIMSSYTNMAMLFLGIEILSIPMYILAGSRKEDALSNEAAFKYLIMGAFATGFLLFGIVLIYGATGSFDLGEIAVFIANNASAIPSIFYIGILLMLVGLSFKVSAVPFHFWAPDVYQGAPTVITAFMSTVVKTAAFAAFLRLFSTSFYASASSWHGIVWVMAALTLLVGNITAVLQTSVKRMLAYSSVAHAGYMLLGLLAGNSFSDSAILTYAAVYSIASIGTFCIISIIDHARGSDNIDGFNGLGKSNPFLAIVMTIALLSLAGIPPTAGFFAKYYIFTSALEAGNVGLVFIAIIASLVGVYYYFRIIIAMYFKEGAKEKIQIEANHSVLLVLVAIATIVLGLFPDCLISLL
ncbi:MAG TPA: NADH-quinone oxidoreductase subunit N [Bacteroidia bacterium]|nr:NADH-quinone oxidoreductase subunit N [Bacteroidia bacterium]